MAAKLYELLQFLHSHYVEAEHSVMGLEEPFFPIYSQTQKGSQQLHSQASYTFHHQEKSTISSSIAQMISDISEC